MELHAEFEALVGPHMSALRAYCGRLTVTRWDAEDLCQEVLLRVFASCLRGSPVEHARPLLYTIARNLRIDAGRKRQLRTVAIAEAAGLAREEMSYASARGLAEWVAEHLSAREARMLMLAAVCRYSYQEIAEEMNSTPAAVKMVLHRAKKTLRAADCDQSADQRRKRQTAAAAPKRIEIDAWTNALLQSGAAVRAVSG